MDTLRFFSMQIYSLLWNLPSQSRYARQLPQWGSRGVPLPLPLLHQEEGLAAAAVAELFHRHKAQGLINLLGPAVEIRHRQSPGPGPKGFFPKVQPCLEESPPQPLATALRRQT